MASTLRVGVLTISDTASVDPASDTSGPALCKLLGTEPRYKVEVTACIPDDFKAIQKTVTAWCDDLDLNVVLTTGGTGFGVRDCTPEAVMPLLDRQTPGITHMIFAKSVQITPFAALSRAVTGIRGQTLVLTFPGSPKAVKENYEIVSKLLPHACDLASGGTGKKFHEKMQGGPRPSGVASPAVPDVKAGEQTAQGHEHGHGHGHGHGGHSCFHHSDREARSEPASLGLDTPVSRRLRKSPYPLIRMEQAMAAVMDQISPLPSVQVPVNESLIGAVLDEDVVAVEAVPGYRAAILDGYAVIDTDGPGQYPVTAVSIATAAAEGAATKLLPGQIARITTGGAVPEGATAVVMVEDTVLVKSSEDGTREEIVEIRAKVRNGEAIREIGSDVQIGQTVLKKGQVISAVGGEIGVLASIGVQKVTVRQRPVVGFLSTGNEVVNHDNGEKLKMGQIRDTNRPTLIAATKAAGIDYKDLGIAPDSPEALEKAVREGLDKCDIVVTTGGVSMGEMDLLKPILEQKLGATIHFGRIMMKPGKPTTFATIPNPNGGQPKLMFALPGNPVSATVTYYLFVIPALRKLAGYEKYSWPSIQAEITHDVRLDERPEYQRAIVSVTSEGRILAQSTDKNQMSSRMVTMLEANSLLVLPGRTEERPNVQSGQKIECLLIGKLG
ncbi:gephyrin [Entomortierella parvispora]|uniref:Gephyrin n=1 Tax=Entomortierella parvispora TaxID=205924 RepID=A0A9P3LTM7_9FUNG|nr:gephyrin [Entomortierella parvispora]